MKLNEREQQAKDKIVELIAVKYPRGSIEALYLMGLIELNQKFMGKLHYKECRDIVADYLSYMDMTLNRNE